MNTLKEFAVKTSVVWAIVILFLAIIASLTVLLSTGSDIAPLISFFGGVLIPSITALFAVSAANKAASASTESKEASEQVARITNGNTARLLELLKARGVDTNEIEQGLIDAGYNPPGDDPSQSTLI